MNWAPVVVLELIGDYAHVDLYPEIKERECRYFAIMFEPEDNGDVRSHVVPCCIH